MAKSNLNIKALRKTLNKHWQGPTLAVGLVLVIVSLVQLMLTDFDPTAEQYLAQIDELRNEDQLDAAREKIREFMEQEPEKVDPHMGHLHRMLSEIAWEQASVQASPPVNLLVTVIEEEMSAREYGMQPDAAGEYRLARCRDYLRHPSVAMRRYEAALYEGLPAEEQIFARKRLIELLDEFEPDDTERIESHVDALLAVSYLAGDEMIWAIHRKCEFLFARDDVEGVRALVERYRDRAVRDLDRTVLDYEIARCDYVQGNLAEADRSLRWLRNNMPVRNVWEGRITLLLAQVNLADDRAGMALSFFDEVKRIYPGTELAVEATLGQAESLAALEDYDQCLSSYRELVDLLQNWRDDAGQDIAAVGRSLIDLSRVLAGQGRYDDAIEFLEVAMSLADRTETAIQSQMYGRLAYLHENAAEVLQSQSGSNTPENNEKRARISAHYLRAGQLYERVSQVPNILGSEALNALWQAVDCYDKAGRRELTIAALERYIGERKNHPTLSEALLRLGQSYEAVGDLSSAERYYRRNVETYRTPAAIQSFVYLARVQMMQGPDRWPAAEKVMLRVIDDTHQEHLVTPEAQEFREILGLLGWLYVSEGRYDEGIVRLREWLDRYGETDGHVCQRFRLAEAYRRGAVILQKQADETQLAEKRNELVQQSEDYIQSAWKLYDEVIVGYESTPDLLEHDGLARVQRRHSYLYRADCAYNLGRFDDAVRLYEQVLGRHERTTAALTAYVQLINLSETLGRPGQLQVYLSRMQSLLKIMDDQVFAGDPLDRDRAYWQQWIDWNYRLMESPDVPDTSLAGGATGGPTP